MIDSIKKEWSSLELYSISSAVRRELIGNIVSCGGCWCCFFLLIVVRLERPILRRTYVRRTGSSRWNKNIFKQIGMLPLSTYLELLGSRWLEKIVNMYGYRIPRKLFGAWLPYARRNSSASTPKQSIRHPYVHTLKLLGYDSCEFKIWMNCARDRKTWAEKIENFLNLPKGMYIL